MAPGGDRDPPPPPPNSAAVEMMALVGEVGMVGRDSEDDGAVAVGLPDSRLLYAGSKGNHLGYKKIHGWGYVAEGVCTQMMFLV